MFAGYGGLDLAVERVLGGRTAWVAEVDKAPSAILARRFPDAPNLGDVTAIDWHAIAADRPVDVITGGSPCQDLSHAGKRRGMRPGTRSGLWAAMCDAVEIIRPRLVVWENVRGALSAPADSAVEPCPFCVGDHPDVTLRALGRVLGDLAELGYDASWVGLRAADVGAPHNRFRVFVLAWPADESAELAAAEPENLGHQRRGHSRLGRPGPADRGGEDMTLLPTPAVNDMGRAYTPEEWDAWTAKMKAAHGNGNGHGPSLEIEAQRMLPTPRATDGTKGGPNQRGSSGDVMLPAAVLLPTPTAMDSKASGGEPGSPNVTLTDATVRRAARFGQYAAAIARWEPIVGREAPPPTEPTGREGAARLSPRFAEWMMGLPDGWVTDVGLSRNDQLKALGNGVVPAQAAAALQHLLGVQRQVVAA